MGGCEGGRGAGRGGGSGGGRGGADLGSGTVSEKSQQVEVENKKICNFTIDVSML